MEEKSIREFGDYHYPIPSLKDLYCTSTVFQLLATTLSIEAYLSLKRLLSVN